MINLNCLRLWQNTMNYSHVSLDLKVFSFRKNKFLIKTVELYRKLDSNYVQ